MDITLEIRLLKNVTKYYTQLKGVNYEILDGGTGYGCAGSSGELPKNIQVIGNRAFYNYRKGIDLHAGIPGYPELILVLIPIH